MLKLKFASSSRKDTSNREALESNKEGDLPAENLNSASEETGPRFSVCGDKLANIGSKMNFVAFENVGIRSPRLSTSEFLLRKRKRKKKGWQSIY
jgi:hypothetical protein